MGQMIQRELTACSGSGQPQASPARIPVADQRIQGVAAMMAFARAISSR
jgi:hypothetical protein